MKRQFESQSQLIRLPNIWDAIAFVFIGTILVLISWGAQQMSTPYAIGDPIAISLSAKSLPLYALRTVVRMGIALIFSLLFSFIFGTLAAKYKRAELIIIPTIDILQSVPILGFLSITIVGFISLFPGNLLGPECAAIFVIFTSQAWNMALSFYQSLKTVPSDLKEAARMYHLTSWQQFWRIEVPFATPSLLWNTMISMSGGWFFVVASEAISVSNQHIKLPGIGSYIAVAIEQQNMHAVGMAILTMLLVILIYDQILFKPLLKWSDKFKMADNTSEEETNSWLFTLFRRTRWLQRVGDGFTHIIEIFVTGFRLPKPKTLSSKKRLHAHQAAVIFWNSLLCSALISGIFIVTHFILTHLAIPEITRVMGLGLITGTRVIVMIALCSLIWIPIGVWVGLRPKWTRIVQPIAQFLAAFPANILFPLVVMVIMRYSLNVEIWTTPLMVLGTQWYILFNVIAGTSSIPKDLTLVAKNLGVKGVLWWKRIALPAIFPYFVTGALAAAGGAWNASIIAEVVNWGDTTLRATGLGAYIAASTNAGDFPRITLGIGIMCLYVLILNRLLWRRLYDYAASRFHFE